MRRRGHAAVTVVAAAAAEQVLVSGVVGVDGVGIAAGGEEVGVVAEERALAREEVVAGGRGGRRGTLGGRGTSNGCQDAPDGNHGG